MSDIALPHHQLSYCSFGSNSGYIEYCETASKWFSARYSGVRSTILTPESLSSPLRAYIESYKKGYGYYRWKPVVVSQCASSLNDGELLLYVDARSGLPEDRIHWLDDQFDRSERNSADFPPYDVICHVLPVPERRDTTADLMASFGFSIDSFEAITGQVSASFFAIRLSPLTRRLIHQWHSFMDARPELCRDEPSKIPNHPSFVHNRYDQSVFSLTVKSFLRLGLKAKFLDSNEISPDRSIYLQAKPHPGLSGPSIFSSFNVHHESLSRAVNNNRQLFGALEFGEIGDLDSAALAGYRVTSSQAKLLSLPLNTEPIDADLITVLAGSLTEPKINYLELGCKAAKTFLGVTSSLNANNIVGSSIAVEYGPLLPGLVASANNAGIRFSAQAFDKRRNHYFQRSNSQVLPVELITNALDRDALNLIYVNKVDDVERLIESIQLLIQARLIDTKEVKFVFSGVEPSFGPNEPKWRLFILIYQYVVKTYKEVQAHALMIGSELGNHAERTTVGILSARN